MVGTILQKLYVIEHMPSFPPLKRLILDTLADCNLSEESGLEKLAESISYDPSLTLEFLKIANSESFGFKNKISSIRHALLILDNDLIKLVITQHPVIPELKVFSSSIKSVIKKYIRHTIEIRRIVKNILDSIAGSRFLNESYRNELINASTLHDIGLFFLLIYFPESYRDIVAGIRQGHSVRQKRSKESLPEHTLTGSLLCKQWNLPHLIRNSIAFHHHPWAGNEVNKAESEILYIADTISESYYDLYFSNETTYSNDEHIIMKKNFIEIMEKQGLNFTDIAGIRARSFEEARKLYSKLEI